MISFSLSLPIMFIIHRPRYNLLKLPFFYMFQQIISNFGAIICWNYNNHNISEWCMSSFKESYPFLLSYLLQFRPYLEIRRPVDYTWFIKSIYRPFVYRRSSIRCHTRWILDPALMIEACSCSDRGNQCSHPSGNSWLGAVCIYRHAKDVHLIVVRNSYIL